MVIGGLRGDHPSKNARKCKAAFGWGPEGIQFKRTAAANRHMFYFDHQSAVLFTNPETLVLVRNQRKDRNAKVIFPGTSAKDIIFIYHPSKGVGLGRAAHFWRKLYALARW